MENIRAWIGNFLQQEPGVLVNLLGSAVIILVLWLLRLLAVALLNRRVRDQLGRHWWRKATAYVAFVVGVVLTGAIWFRALGSVATILGLASAGLVVALQSPLTNLAGWVFIILRRPFGIGDRIQIGEHAGDVVDVRVFQFSLLEIMKWVDADQSTGRVIHVPNGQVFDEAIINYWQIGKLAQLSSQQAGLVIAALP